MSLSPNSRISQKQIFSFFVSLTVLSLFVGCSNSDQPTESAARKIIEDRIAKQSKGGIKLASFRKTNATSDAESYRMEFDAEIEFLSDGAWSQGSAMNMNSSVQFDFSTRPVGGGAMDQIMGTTLGTKNVRRGQRETIKDSILFQKTENGWREFTGM